MVAKILVTSINQCKQQKHGVKLPKLEITLGCGLMKSTRFKTYLYMILQHNLN